MTTPRLAAAILLGALLAGVERCPAQETESEILGADLDFFIGLDAGGGLASPVCASCQENGPQAGTTGSVFIGFGNGRDLLIGLQPSIWAGEWGMWQSPDLSDPSQGEVVRANFMAFASWYPSRRPGWNLRGGAGWSLFRASNRFTPPLKDLRGNDLVSQVIAEGPGLMAGGGFDFRVARKLFLTFTLSYFYGHLGTLVLDVLDDLHVRRDLHVVELNVGFMFRPKNR